MRASKHVLIQPTLCRAMAGLEHVSLCQCMRGCGHLILHMITLISTNINKNKNRDPDRAAPALKSCASERGGSDLCGTVGIPPIAPAEHHQTQSKHLRKSCESHRQDLAMPWLPSGQAVSLRSGELLCQDAPFRLRALSTYLFIFSKSSVLMGASRPCDGGSLIRFSKCGGVCCLSMRTHAQ